MKPFLKSIFIIGVVIAGTQACSGTQQLGSSADEKIYDQSYNAMTDIVEEALKRSTLTIIAVNESKEDREMSFSITASRYANTSGTANQHQGKVIVSAISDTTSKVQVENPEYHYTVPDYEKEDYTRQVFDQLNKALTSKN